MPHQEVQSYLSAQPGSDRARAAAWDAVYNVPDDNRAQQLIGALPYPNEVKAVLWEYRTKAGSEQAPAQPEGSAVGRFASGVASQLNPVTIAQGLYGAVRHPVDTATSILGASADQARQAYEAGQRGRYSEAIGHGFGAFPIIGPMAAQAGEQIASGDIAGGLGRGAGLLAPFGVSAIARGRVAAQAGKGVPATLEREAAQQVSQRVLGPGAARFKGKAEAIAPEILRRGMKGGRAELAEAAEEGMAKAGQQIDDVIQAGGGPKAGVIIDPIIGQLQRKIESLTVNGEPIKGAEARVQGLQARIDQLKRVSQEARQPEGLVKEGQAAARARYALSFEDLRKIRDEQYRLADEARSYERAGNPHLSAEGFAARETGGAIRQEFARLSPELADANAEYTFFKTLGDVLDPAQGRPKVTAPSAGITGGAATSGAVAGHLVGPKAAFVLGVVRPWIQRMKSEPAWQLADAHSKMQLAAAIRNGDLSLAQKVMTRIGEAAVLTNPIGSQSRTTAPASR